MQLPRCLQSNGEKTHYCFNSQQFKDALKSAIKQIVEICGDSPAFAGIDFDEWANLGGYCPACIESFRNYLKQKYSAEALRALGVDAVESAAPPPVAEQDDKNRVLSMEHNEFIAHTFENLLAEMRDYLHTLKGDALLAYSNTCGGFGIPLPFTSSLARTPNCVDIFMMDPYWSGVIEEAFISDLVRSNSKVPYWLVMDGFQHMNLKRYAVDLSISLAHADGVSPFAFPYVCKYPPKGNLRGYWTAGRWEITQRLFNKIKATEQYLVRTESPSETGLLYSERTAALDNPKKQDSILLPYTMNQMGLYCALSQEHIQVDPVFADTLSAKQLRKYKVLIASDARALTEEEAALLKAWVEEGGTLVTTAQTSSLDRWGRKLNDYALADLFGVKYKGSVKSPDKIRMKIVRSGSSGLEPGREVICEGTMGYDQVIPSGGEIVAQWEDNNPAIVVNQSGKGRSIFISAVRPGLCYEFAPTGNCHLGSLVQNVEKDFFPGVKELFAGIVGEACRDSGIEPAFVIRNCPANVEVVMRVQPDKNRYILHFLNYTEEGPVSGALAQINVPLNGASKVFYPEDQKNIDYIKQGGKIFFPVRDFDAHEMIVIDPCSGREP
ncbi:MAG: beta-galactosidase trimerization domain-containing protein [Kiritimatiellae bacterium]|nr:beta-galactosidase trimerization domain-containing protein [Kiritimatiellia bacterium]